MSKLEILHAIESRVGHDLDMETGDRILDYLDDDPVSTDVEYLVELFNLEGKTHIANLNLSALTVREINTLNRAFNSLKREIKEKPLAFYTSPATREADLDCTETLRRKLLKAAELRK